MHRKYAKQGLAEDKLVIKCLSLLLLLLFYCVSSKTAFRLSVPWAGPVGRAPGSTLDGNLETEPHQGKSLTKPVVSEVTCVAGVKCCEFWSQM